ncbi:MAG: DUF2079 domain-containing protein [Candidatus Omnitrophica bacterium]|nr:DUF2079 domain-containing protein [Candidatus Omnitrophota bacterium]
MLNSPSRFNSVALWTCGLIFCVWSFVVFIKYYAFQYTGWDLSLAGQLMWGLCQGTTKTSLFGGSFLLDHSNYIAFLLVPIYFFFQSALTLLILKTFTFFVGAYILYLFARKHLGPMWGFLFMLGYIFYPANTSMFFFEFNFENLAAPLILLAFYLLEEKRLIPFLITCFILCLVKENMPLVVMMIGLYATFIHRKSIPHISRWAPAVLLLGLGLFLLQIFVIQPHLTKDLGFHQSNYWEFYKKLGKNPLEIIKTILFHPQTTFPLIFAEKNILFLEKLFGPLVIPAIMNPWVLLLGLPLFLQNLLSSFYGQQSVNYYYSCALVVFIFLAAIKTLAILQTTQQKRLLILIILSIFIFDLTTINEWKRRIPKPKPTLIRLKTHSILSLIPKDAGVISSFKYLPWLSQRKDLYLLSRARVSFTREKEQIPDSVEYILFDLASPRNDDIATKNLLRNKKWSVLAVSGDVILLKKNIPQGKPLIQVLPQAKIPESKRLSLTLSSLITLEGIDIPEVISSSSQLLPVTYYWEVLKKQKGTAIVRMVIKQLNKRIWVNDRDVAYSFPLNKGEHITDRAYYSIPPLAAGTYEIRIFITQRIRMLLKNEQYQSDAYIQKITVR